MIQNEVPSRVSFLISGGEIVTKLKSEEGGGKREKRIEGMREEERR